jgi:predicted O-linked N-acetylglucosamine transferase (SPINDLY family)
MSASVVGGQWRGEPHGRLFFPNHHPYDDGEMVSSPPARDAHVPESILALKRAGARVMCNFGRAFKLDPLTLATWARILRRAPNAVIWMVDYGTSGETSLRSELARMMSAMATADPESSSSSSSLRAATSPALLAELARANATDSRLVVTEFLPRDSHLIGKRACDLYLDTAKYNSHTTAVESLWSGVPIVTYPVSRMSSRVTASALAVLGLESDLVATSFGDYVDKAVNVLTNGTLALRVRDAVERTRPGDRRADGRPQSSLWDIPGWTEEFLRVLHVAYEVRVAQGRPFHIA